MKKLFISCPMKGRTNENIEMSIEKMHKMAEIIFDQPLEVIDSFFKGDIPKTNNQAVYYLGRSIQKIADADYFIGVRYNHNFKGCGIEAMVANDYNIPSFLIGAEEFMPDIKEQMRANKRRELTSSTCNCDKGE